MTKISDSLNYIMGALKRHTSTLPILSKSSNKKILVWAAISSAGISLLHTKDSTSSEINCGTYVSKCLTLLERFIKIKNCDYNIIFSPGLPSSHYANKTFNWFTEKNINFVPK